MAEHVFAYIANGIVSNVCVADATWETGVDITNLDPRPGVGWSYDGRTFQPPASAPQPEPLPIPRAISRRAFRDRIGVEALTHIEMASIDDPAAPLADRQLSASLRVLKDTLLSSKHVDLDFPQTQGELQALVAAGFLTAAKADAILTAPVLEHELP